jgi:hypothetical protein
MAFDMGRAIPDATFGYEEGFLSQEAKTDVADNAESSSDESSSEEDSLELREEIEKSSSEEEVLSWSVLCEAGKYEDAMKALALVVPPSQEDQIILNRIFSSKQAEKMVFVSQAAIRFHWKSMALKLRIGLRHPVPKVRASVVKAIGILAGPSLSPAIELMRTDVDEGVRNEVARALKRLKKG